MLLPKFLTVIPLLVFCGILCRSQESLHVDNVCAYDTDHLKEVLYAFPSDKRSVEAFEYLILMSGKQLDVTVRASNVPDVVTVESHGERLLLYNQLTLNTFEASDKNDLRIAMVMAHQVGHLVSRHSLGVEPKLRVEIELEADRFSGYVLFRLGASLADVRAVSKRVDWGQHSASYPIQPARLAAVIEGWHDGKAELGGGADFELGAENIPTLDDWPPPQASGNMDVPRDLLVKGMSKPRLMDVASHLIRALDKAGYAERSFYAVPHGFALVSRVERIYADGKPKEGDDRWPIASEPPRIFSIISYLRALFTSNPGFYRVIVFVVSDLPIVQSAPPTKYRSPRDWVWAGANKIPTVVGFTGYTSSFSCVALVYEFQQPARGVEPVINIPGALPGRVHMARSSLLQYLGEF